jgi:hypothetical protein
MEDKTMIVIGAILLGAVLFVLLLIPATHADVLGALGKGNLKFNLNPTPTGPAIDTTKLQLQDLKVGTSSAQVDVGDTITVNYIGALMDGKMFDSSYARKQPLTVTVGEGKVIVGFEKGVIGMKIGGKRRLIIPASMAYGPQGQGPIPPNTPIQFIIELLSITKAKPSPSVAPTSAAVSTPTPTNPPSSNSNSNSNPSPTPTPSPSPSPTPTPTDSPTPTPSPTP